jgi:hypothetical protein
MVESPGVVGPEREEIATNAIFATGIRVNRESGYAGVMHYLLPVDA